MRRFRRVGMEALAVAAGQALAAAGAVIAVRVVTEAIPPEEYGRLALAMTIGTLGLQVLLAPLTTSALRFFSPAREAGDLRGFLLAVRQLVGACVMLVALLAVLTVAGLFVASRSVWIPLALASLGFTLFAGVSSVLDGIQNASRHRVVAAAHSGLAPWLRFLAAVGVIYLFSTATSAAAMTGYAVASAVILASQLYFVRRFIVPMAAAVAVDRDRWVKAMLAYGGPFATWGIFAWAQMTSDRWALGTFASAREVGYYAVVYQLGFYPILTASTLIGQVFSPILYARAGDATDPSRVAGAIRINNRLAMLMLGLTAAGALLTGWLHPLIGRLLLAPEYREVTHYLPWMVVAGGIFATGQVAALLFMIRNRSSELALPKIVTALLGVAANFAGAKWFGVPGVIAALIGFGVVFCAWIWAASWRAMGRGAEAVR